MPRWTEAVVRRCYDEITGIMQATLDAWRLNRPFSDPGLAQSPFCPPAPTAEPATDRAQG